MFTMSLVKILKTSNAQTSTLWDRHACKIHRDLTHCNACKSLYKYTVSMLKYFQQMSLNNISLHNTVNKENFVKNYVKR